MESSKTIDAFGYFTLFPKTLHILLVDSNMDLEIRVKNMYNFGYNDFYSCYGQMDYNLVRNLEEYIHDELKDSRYYAILAMKAPTPRAKKLLMEFSKDEKMHAESFIKEYGMITDIVYCPPMAEEPQVPEYEEALKMRILAETSDYKKYGEQYLKAKNQYLKDLFYMTRTVEAQHAMRIPFLMAEK